MRTEYVRFGRFVIVLVYTHGSFIGWSVLLFGCENLAIQCPIISEKLFATLRMRGTRLITAAVILAAG